MTDELVSLPREATVGMLRALTKSFADSPEARLFVAQWAAGSFAEDYSAMIAAAAVQPVLQQLHDLEIAGGIGKYI